MLYIFLYVFFVVYAGCYSSSDKRYTDLRGRNYAPINDWINTDSLIHDAVESPDNDEIEKNVTVLEEERDTKKRRNDNHNTGPINHRNTPTTPADTDCPSRNICDGCHRNPAKIERESRESDVFIVPCESSCVFSDLDVCLDKRDQETEHDDD